MKNITPMQRLKAFFDDFHKEIRGVAEVEEKHKAVQVCGGRKGVSADYIRFYSGWSHPISFSFVFDYVNKSQPNIVAQVKKGGDNDSIESSRPYSVDELKPLLRGLVNNIKESKTYSKSGYELYGSVVDAFEQFFLQERMDYDGELEKVISAATKELSRDKADIVKFKRKSKKARATLSVAHSAASSELHASSAYKEMRELQRQLMKAQASVRSLEVSLEMKHGVKELEHRSRETQQNLDAACSKYIEHRDEIVDKSPWFVQPKLKDAFKTP